MRLLAFVVIAVMAFAPAQVPDIPLPGIPLPDIPLPDIPLPELPEIPEFPDLPSLPDIPGLPDLPFFTPPEPLPTEDDEVVGVLSFIEDLPDPLSDEGLFRRIPFIEVLQLERFEACRDVGFDETACEQMEWSVPFVPEQVMNNFERALVRAWLRFELRSYHRHRVEIGMGTAELQTPILLSCTAGVADRAWTLVTGEPIFPASEFCEGANFFNCAECSAIFAPVCPNLACLKCMVEGYFRAQAKQLQYYADYLADVATAVATHLPTSLWWELPLDGTGAIMTPIMDLATPLPGSLLLMLREATEAEVIAPLYYLQTAAYLSDTNPTCQPIGMPKALLDALVMIPGYGYNADNPGIETLEAYKYRLSNRESVSEVRERHLSTQFAAYPPESMQQPFFARTGTYGTPAYDANSTPFMHACYGYSPLLMTYAELDVIVEFKRPLYRTACVPIGNPLIPFPWFFAGFRMETDLVTVPEGYEIPYVQGVPLFNVP
jgi:hypothetical protein